MSKSSEVDGGGVAATAGSIDSSAIVSPIEEGGGGATPEDSTLRRLELAQDLRNFQTWLAKPKSHTITCTKFSKE